MQYKLNNYEDNRNNYGDAAVYYELNSFYKISNFNQTHFRLDFMFDRDFNVISLLIYFIWEC